MSKTKPLHARARDQILRTAGACGQWCRQWRFFDQLLPTAFLFGVLCLLLFYVTLGAPIDFPSATLVKIDANATTQSVAAELKARHIIRSPLAFELVARLYGAGGHIVAGEYFFPGPQTVLTVGRRLAHGDFELIPVRVTIPEGVDVLQMSALLSSKIVDFDTQAFVNAGESKEGYLFPDTYFFLPGEEPLTVIATLEENFKEHLAQPAVSQAIASFNKPLSDIVTMASLLEREAPDMHDRRIIAGILWRRVALNMPLQVDAVFPYIIGKNSLELTHADLKTESPYNTYTNKGLPPGPIANPGIDSILAAATPITSNYLYYLSDKQGNFHYCATYACQSANQKKYLK